MFKHVIVFEDSVCKNRDSYEEKKLWHLGIKLSLVKLPKLFFENDFFSWDWTFIWIYLDIY